MNSPIILIHGLWLTPLSWEGWKARFEQHGHEVLAPAWPGMAAYGIRTILQKDLNAVMGVVMVSGVFFVMVNLVIDLLVGLVDPRVRIRGSRP